MAHLTSTNWTFNSSGWSDDELEVKLRQPYILFYLCITGVMSSIGIAGNLMTIATFILTPALHQIWNSFVVNLAVADLLVTGIVMPYSIFGVVAGKQYFVERPVLCKFLATICAPGCLASMYTICWISCTRYFYICKFSTYLKYFSRRSTASFICSIWLMCFLVHSPNHFGWGDSKYSSGFQLCTLDVETLSYSFFYGSCMIAAMIATFVFYWKTYQTVRKSNLAKKMITRKNSDKSDNNHEHHSRILEEMKLAKTSFKIFLIFVCFWTPTAILILMGVNSNVPSPVYLYSVLMAHSNSTLNFFIYYIDNKMFKNGCKQLFKRLLGEKRFGGVGHTLHTKGEVGHTFHT